MKANNIKVVILIFVHKDKILIEKRNLEGFKGEQYLIPGGNVDLDENIEDKVHRQ